VKKSKLALAVAGAPAIAHADAKLYGRTRPQLRPAQQQYWDWRAVSRQINRSRRNTSGGRNGQTTD